MPTDTLTLLSAIWLGTLFVYSGALKAASPATQNVRTVEAYRLVAPPAARVVGRVLPGLELVVGAIILLGPFASAGTAAAGVLGVVFVAASGSVLVRGIKTSCGCAGQLSEPIGPASVLRATLIAITGFATSASWAATLVPLTVGAPAFVIALLPTAWLVLQRRRRASCNAHPHAEPMVSTGNGQAVAWVNAVSLPLGERAATRVADGSLEV